MKFFPPVSPVNINIYRPFVLLFRNKYIPIIYNVNNTRDARIIERNSIQKEW